MPDITIIEDDYALNNGIALALKSCDYTINQIQEFSKVFVLFYLILQANF